MIQRSKGTGEYCFYQSMVMPRITKSDVDVLELHDAFTINTLLF